MSRAQRSHAGDEQAPGHCSGEVICQHDPEWRRVPGMEELRRPTVGSARAGGGGRGWQAARAALSVQEERVQHREDSSGGHRGKAGGWLRAVRRCTRVGPGLCLGSSATCMSRAPGTQGDRVATAGIAVHSTASGHLETTHNLGKGGFALGCL